MSERFGSGMALLKDQLCEEILRSDCEKRPEFPRNFLIGSPPRYIHNITYTQYTWCTLPKAASWLIKSGANRWSSPRRIIQSTVFTCKQHVETAVRVFNTFLISYLRQTLIPYLKKSLTNMKWKKGACAVASLLLGFQYMCQFLYSPLIQK